MNRAVRDEWVRRLRSGDYAQGRGALVRLTNLVGDAPEGTVPGEFCCLGVLCEVARDAGLVERAEESERGYRRADQTGCPSATDPRYPRYAWYGGVLPPVVVEWAGLRSADPVVANASLSDHNDGRLTRRRTFTEIARLIEENL